jgi:hypothetical protein
LAQLARGGLPGTNLFAQGVESLAGGLTAGLSLGTDVCVNDQFVSAATCSSICQTLNGELPMSGVTHEAPIDPNIIICHAVRREALLEAAAHLVAIQRGHLLQRGASLIDIFDDQAIASIMTRPKSSGQQIGNNNALASRRNGPFSRSLISPMNSTPSADSNGCTAPRK